MVIDGQRDPQSALAGRAAIVTGAAGAIGLAITRTLASEGASVVLVDANAVALQHLDQIAHADGSIYRTIAADVTHEADLMAAVQLALDAFGRLDIVINNAADLSEVPLTESTAESWQRQLAVNLIAPAELVRIALPHLTTNRGVVVNVASVRALASVPGAVAYESSKAGLLGLTRALATELASLGIAVNAVCPGFVPRQSPWDHGLDDRERAANVAVHAGMEPGRPEDIAAVVAFLCSDAARIVNGATLVADGAVLAQHPYLAAKRALEAPSAL